MEPNDRFPPNAFLINLDYNTFSLLLADSQAALDRLIQFLDVRIHPSPFGVFIHQITGRSPESIYHYIPNNHGGGFYLSEREIICVLHYQQQRHNRYMLNYHRLLRYRGPQILQLQQLLIQQQQMANNRQVPEVPVRGREEPPIQPLHVEVENIGDQNGNVAGDAQNPINLD